MEIKLPEKLAVQQREDSQPWLLSYSDMVTLLLAFFVLFFAISQVDQAKFETIMQYFSQKNTMPLHVLEQKFKELVQEHYLQKSVDVQLTPDGLLVNFQDNILFESGKAELNTRAYPILDALAGILREPAVAQRSIQVEGHTDTVPLSKVSLYPSNWELSGARSARVIRYLIATGLNRQRFISVGYADTRLRVPESPDRKGLQVNRRVSLLIK